MKEKIKNYRILNLEGSWFKNIDNEYVFSSTEDKVFLNKDKKEIKIKSDNDKLYTATMPYSLETDRAFTKYPNEVLNEDLVVADEKYIKNSKKELFTKLFVNFKFTKDLFQDDVEESEDKEIQTKRINKKKVRKLIYTSNVLIDGILYKFYKRGASKARTANVIFCKAEYCDELLKPSLLGLKFKDGKFYDVTSKEAYTSLIMSRIIGKINITKDQILIINDLNSPSFKAKQTKTIMNEDGKVIQKEDEFDVENNMTDGEGLADESIFLENKFLNEATCALLRNDFLKSNALRTKLQEYYKKIFGENYENAKVWDMFRGWIPAKSIRLVITPSSCKYLKFFDQFKTNDNSEFEAKRDCYLDWLERIPNDFGVVKTDHVGNYEYSNRLSYQMWNSMNLSREDVAEILKDELDYFKLLKDNTLVGSDELKKLNATKKAEEREKRNEMSYFLKYINDTDEELDLKTIDMLSALLNKNSDFRFTTKFKDWKNEQLQDYIENLRLGKVRIQNSIYAIMISCPYEMLVSTIKEDNKIDSCIMTGWECYNPHYAEGTELIAIRNPQINEGNICNLTNKYHEEFQWFGYQVDGIHKHDFVTFVNTWDCDIMNRGQGMDFDIDTMYFSDMELLVRKSKEAQQYSTPVNGIKGKSELREYSEKSLSDLDNYLGGSTMSIGKIVNKSAIFNAYMYHEINTKKHNYDYIKNCYKASSTLSSCSQIAIDMAKKSFIDSDGKPLSLTKIMNQLNKTTYGNIPCIKYEEKTILQYAYDGLRIVTENELNIDTMNVVKRIKDLDIKECKFTTGYSYIEKTHIEVKENGKTKEIKYIAPNGLYKAKVPVYYSNKYLVQDKKMVVPKFFEFVAQDNSYRIPTPMECGMDYLEKMLDKDNLKTKSMATDVKKIQDLVNPQSNFKGGAFSKTKIDDARKIIDKCQNILDNNRPKANDSSEEKTKKAHLRRWAKQTAIKDLKKLEMNEKTVLRIIQRAFDIDEKYKGNIINKLNKEGKEIKYTDKKTGKEKVLVYREFKEMAMLTLTLMYNTNPKTFIECFKKKKTKKIEIEDFWK